MTAPIPSTEPASVNAGDTVKWTKSLADYLPADSWVLTYTLINADSKITIVATTSGTDHLVSVATATSAAWTAGTYDYRAQVSKAGEVFTVGSGRMVVKPAYSPATLDNRSQVRKTLEAIEATLEGRATSSTAEYEIAGRKLKYIPIPELLQLRDRLRQDVAREDAATKIAQGMGNPNRIFVRFGA